MTSRELEILNIIYRLGGQCSGRIISKETNLSPDYAFLIAKGLLKQKLIKKIANNVFILTIGGRSFLERRRGRLEKKKNTSTLLAVSRSFGSSPSHLHRCGGKVEPPLFEPEIHFINPEAIHSGCYGVPGQPCLTEHNLDKDVTIEVAPARSIQKSLKRLTTAKI